MTILYTDIMENTIDLRPAQLLQNSRLYCQFFRMRTLKDPERSIPRDKRSTANEVEIHTDLHNSVTNKVTTLHALYKIT